MIEEPIKSKERIDSTGEVFTPRKLVEDMLDGFPPEIWCDPSKTFLEPSCGDGNFLVVILERLMLGLSNVIPDPTERHKHIVENQIFAVDYMPDNVEATIDRLNARNLNHNIVWANSLNYDFMFGRSEIDDFGFEIQPMNPLHSFSEKDLKNIDTMTNKSENSDTKTKVENLFNELFD